MPYITMFPSGQQIELPKGSPLTDVEYESFGEKLIPFACRLGVCGACAVEVIEGRNRLGQAELGEKLFLSKLGYNPDSVRLACQCRLFGNVTVKPAIRAKSTLTSSLNAISLQRKSPSQITHDV